MALSNVLILVVLILISTTVPSKSSVFIQSPWENELSVIIFNEAKKLARVSLAASAIAIPPTPSDAAIAFTSIPSCVNKKRITTNISRTLTIFKIKTIISFFTF